MPVLLRWTNQPTGRRMDGMLIEKKTELLDGIGMKDWYGYGTGAQITLLRGNALVPHPLLWRNEASLAVTQCAILAHPWAMDYWPNH